MVDKKKINISDDIVKLLYEYGIMIVGMDFNMYIDQEEHMNTCQKIKITIDGYMLNKKW